MNATQVRVLIVDDLPEKLLVYKVILEDLGAELVTALSGAEALKLVLTGDFAVILLDVNMPDLDGFETARWIRTRKRSAHTPIIFVTSFVDELRLAEGYASGAVDYIQAPVIPEILRAKVKVFVDLFHMNEQIKRQAEEQVILAEERSRREAAEEANARLRFLAHASTTIGQSLDHHVTSRDLLRLTVPTLADQSVIAQLEPITGLWAIMEASKGESDEATLNQFKELSFLPAHTADALERTLQTATTEFLTADSSNEPHTVILPLRGRGHTFAALLLSREGSSRTFSPADVSMAETLASRGAVALDNARLYKDVEHANQQKNEFLSMLAHELRNPLAPIRNAVYVLREHHEENPDILWAREVIGRQVTNMVRLVDDLLDVSRITRGKIRLECKCLDIVSPIESAIETSRPIIDAHDHRLSVQLPGQPIYVHADETRLSQVLSNLLNNAAKYTPAGGEIWLTAGQEGDEAVFRVRDTGTGISPEMLPRIFELFAQAEQSLDRSQGGLGIGLTLVKRLVEMHGGSVQAASAGQGRGSELTVRLPVVGPPRGTGPQLDSPGEAGELSRRRVLIVDDNVDSAETLAQLFRCQEHSVSVMFDGKSALQEIRNSNPEVVVMDLGLPGMSGYDVARAIRAEMGTEGPLLIAVSGYGRQEDQDRCREAGFDQHLIKPVNFAALLKMIQKGLAPLNSTLQVT